MRSCAQSRTLAPHVGVGEDCNTGYHALSQSLMESLALDMSQTASARLQYGDNKLGALVREMGRMWKTPNMY